jgi:hypothetical protein
MLCTRDLHQRSQHETNIWTLENGVFKVVISKGSLNREENDLDIYVWSPISEIKARQIRDTRKCGVSPWGTEEDLQGV